MVCTWLIDSDQFESAQVQSAHPCLHLEPFSSNNELHFSLNHLTGEFGLLWGETD